MGIICSLLPSLCHVFGVVAGISHLCGVLFGVVVEVDRRFVQGFARLEVGLQGELVSCLYICMSLHHCGLRPLRRCTLGHPVFFLSWRGSASQLLPALTALAASALELVRMPLCVVLSRPLPVPEASATLLDVELVAVEPVEEVVGLAKHSSVHRLYLHQTLWALAALVAPAFAGRAGIVCLVWTGIPAVVLLASALLVEEGVALDLEAVEHLEPLQAPEHVVDLFLLKQVDVHGLEVRADRLQRVRGLLHVFERVSI